MRSLLAGTRAYVGLSEGGEMGSLGITCVEPFISAMDQFPRTKI